MFNYAGSEVQMELGWTWPFRWRGRVVRKQYLVAGIALAALKFALDSAVAAAFGERWLPWNYLIPWLGGSATSLPNHALIMRVLAFTALPFLWSGVALTVRRLRDAGRDPALALIFFLPFANLAMFAALCVDPSSDEQEISAPTTNGAKLYARWGDKETALGIVLGAATGLILIVFSTRVLLTYAWGLFLGVPFFTGFITAALQNMRQLRSAKATIQACIATQILIGLVLIGRALEGVVCLAMALPIALPIAIGGALLGREFAQRRQNSWPPRMAASIGVLPLLIIAEYLHGPQPPVHPVTTSVVINAPVEKVWKNVVTFPALAPPTEMIFRVGIAYPTSATIVGTGPGAVRYCHFNTGDFVEPITTWDEGHLLAFSVTAQPQALREMSPWKILPAHIEHNYFRSQHGQFRLEAIDADHTLLEGTTWYQDYFWPQSYWNIISDQIVHRIHLRVLQHVKQQAELGALRGDID